MNITFFVEIFPNESHGAISTKKMIPAENVLFKKLAVELSQILESDVKYLEGSSTDFPAEGIVLYYPFLGKFSSIFFEGITNHNRIILFGISQSEIKGLLHNADLAAFVSMISLMRYEENNPKFVMYGKSEICRSKVIDVEPYFVQSTEKYAFLDYKKFTGLPDVIAWFIKALAIEITNQSNIQTIQGETKNSDSQYEAEAHLLKLMEEIKAASSEEDIVLSSNNSNGFTDPELLQQELESLETLLVNFKISLKNIKNIYNLTVQSYSLAFYHEPFLIHIVFSKSEYVFHVGYTIDSRASNSLESHIEELNSIIITGKYREYLERLCQGSEFSSGRDVSDYFLISRRIKHPFKCVITSVSKTHSVAYLAYKYLAE